MSTCQDTLDLESRVGRFIRANGLVQPGQTLLAAVSGGPDSVCLLHTLYRLRSELDITLHVAHLDHQLRGSESAADARYVADLAHRLGLPVTIAGRNVKSYQAEHHLTLEEAAREVRYLFLAETASKTGAAQVAVGHTLNDQVETVLLHIIRGSGGRGLRGLQPSQRLQFSGQQLIVVRPLLEIKREETERYCARLNLAPCLDTSNLSLDVLRNRVRRELLPLLKQYNPGIFDSLLRLSRLAQDDLAFLNIETEKAWQKVACREHDIIILDKARFGLLTPALQRNLLRKAIEDILGTLKDIETRHIEEIMVSLDKPAGRQVTLPEGLVFSIEYDRYLMGAQTETLTPYPPLRGSYPVRIPGSTIIPGWNIEANIKEIEPGAGSGAFISNEKDSFSACLDFDLTGPDISLRTRLPGDWFQPLGLDSTKKVGRFMVDAHVPRSWRSRIPVLENARQIIWVAGWRLDDRVKVTPDTRRILCLRLTQTTP